MGPAQTPHLTRRPDAGASALLPSWRMALGAAACYVACTCLYFFPVLAQMGRALIGPPEDNMALLWFLWYGSKALVDPHLSFMHTSLIYYPEGVSLYLANYFYYGICVAVFLKPFLSMAAIYNVLVLHTFVLAGLGAFVLAYYFTRNFWASLAGGFVFGFNPSHYAQSLHHANIASLQFIPWFVWCVLYASRGFTLHRLCLCALFLVLNALCDWNYLVYSLVFLALFWAYRAVRKRSCVPMPETAVVLGSGLIAGACLSPLLVPMARLGLNHPEVKLPGHDIYVADLCSFFIPSIHHLLSGLPWIRHFDMRVHPNFWEGAVYLGLVNLALVAWAWPKLGRVKWPLLGALAAFGWLAMGVSAHVNGRALQVPMPYRLIEMTPLLSHARNPSRIMAFGYLFLALLVALALCSLLSSGGRDKLRRALVALACVALFLDFYSVCTEATPVQLPHVYRLIQQDPEKDFAILEIPWEAGRYEMYQTLHGIPLLQGYLGRRTSRSLIHRLDFDLRRLPEQKKTLEGHHVKYIVIFKKQIIRDAKKSMDPAFSFERYDKSIGGFFEKMIQIYARVYSKLYEDADTALFRVYERLR